MKAIAMFNNKGGVGKTTLLCNIASYLQVNLHKKVLVIDVDPQCNTTTYALDDETFLKIYYEEKRFTVNDIVIPLKTRGSYISSDKIKVIKSQGFGFDLIPGDPKLAEKEDFLAGDWKDFKASEIRGIRTNMLFFNLLDKCSDYDFVFFDMGPSLGAINRAVILACDFFITPMSSDVFSVLALENIGNSISNWKNRFNTTLSNISSEDEEGLETEKKQSDVKFLGYVYQQYITKTTNGSKRVVQAYEKILQTIPDKIQEYLIIKVNLDQNSRIKYNIGSIPNFYSLIPMSQTSHKPVFALTNIDGVVGAHYQKVKEYEILMKEIAENICLNMEALND